MTSKTRQTLLNILLGILLVGALALILFWAGGCMTPWGMNMQTQQERQVEESQSAKAVAETETGYEGPLEDHKTITQEVSGKGAKGTINLPAEPQPAEKPVAKLTHAQGKAAQGEASGETKESARFWQKNPWTLLLIGAGIIVVAIGIGKLWALIKDTAIGQAARAADQATRRMIDGMRARMQTETDPGKLDALKDAVLEAEAKLGGVA